MDDRERYFWDLTGYLIVKGVLGPEELRRANEGVDFCLQNHPLDPGMDSARQSRALAGSQRLAIQTDMVLLTLEKPHCDPFREMLAHPQVVARLNAMCGPGFRFDHGPHFIGGVKGTEGLVMHGAGEPHRPYVGYHHQGGEFHCQGVTVSWFLADARAGDGGFACVPGSHKSREPLPPGVRSCDDDMGVVEQPAPRPTAPCAGTPTTSGAPSCSSTPAAPPPGGGFPAGGSGPSATGLRRSSTA